MEIEIDGIGLVLFERSFRARNINIRIKSPSKVRVAVPIGVSFEKAKKVAISKRGWIKRNIKKFSNQINLNNQLESIDLGAAKRYLIDRLDYLARLHSFNYNKITIRNQKTRWGSCSADNNISLNIKLACLPKLLIDYVIMHELVHTKIKNHSPSFWSFLDKYIPGAKKIDKSLKRYSCA